MPLAIVCPACKAKLKAPDALIGKTVKCPGCTKPILVKEAGVAASVPAPAAKRPAKPHVEEEPIDEAEEVEEPRAEKKPKKIDAGNEAALGGPTTDKERGTGMWIHLLPIILGCCGGIGSLISLILWLSKRKESAFIDHHGKAWLNFTINLFAVGMALGILSAVLGSVAGFLGATMAMIVNGFFGLVLFAFSIYSIIMHIQMGLKAKRGEWAEYRVLFKVLK